MTLNRRRLLEMASLTALAATGVPALAEPAAAAAGAGRPSPHALPSIPGGLYHPNVEPLSPTALLRLPVTAVRPRGWLAGQLRLQLEGLCGRYDEISHFLDLDTTGWAHPDRAGWEEVPYWLRGFVDLAIVTRDKDALARAQRWIDAIIATQRPDGFFGPEPLRTALDGGPDFWPFLPLLQALRSWQEYSDDDRVIPLLTRFLQYMNTQKRSAFDRSWVSLRWADCIDTAVWLYNRTREPFLLDLMDKMHSWGANWAGPSLPNRHNVNIAQGFREPAQYAARSHAQEDVRAAYRTYDSVLREYGQFPGGGFAGDENVRPGLTDPRQGFETCGVVEFMASHELLTRLTGDPVWADRCEDLAYNALPPSLDPEGRGVHYVTSANSIGLDNNAKTQGQFQNHWAMQSYRPGVDQYRCCPHNYGMGWPWFTQELFTATPDHGLCATMYAPCEVSAKVGDSVAVTVREDTSYPFGETVTFTLSLSRATDFPFLLRVPGWCRNPEITVNGQLATARPGPDFVRLERTWRDGDTVVLHMPQHITARTWRGNKDSVTIDRGPLTYALQIGEQYVRTGGSDVFPEYDVRATSPWNYGLATDHSQPTAGMKFTASAGALSDNPFTQETVPYRITAPARRIPEWRADNQGVVEPLQASPALSTEPVETVTLIPLGAARLRISAFPLASPSGTPWRPAGAFVRLVNRRSGKALAVGGEWYDDSAPVLQVEDSGTSNRLWQLVDDGGGRYRLRNAISGKVLGVDSMSHDDDARVVQYADNGTADHVWQLVDAGDGWYRLRNTNSGKALGILGASTADGAHAVQRPDDDAEDCLWRFLPDGPVRVENRNSGKVLAVSEMSRDDGARVVQYADSGTADHLWTFLPDADGWYRMRNEHSGKVLGVDGMSREDSAQVVQYADNGTADHQWRLIHAGAGFFRILNRHSGKVLGVDGMSREDSAQVVQYADNGTADHLWRLI
ncbi:RICIN domain-containing protein [Streptomyces sp. MA15]|uniref:RICIN domain-containing protein n=1 Tax=Streptomyces sp. MA15 TaxID=3055061 RepID=UPI0025AFB890|nr:RICIN domain-containing protein [Streptomyces sp. MA15]MDN3272289.1 glycoside hydrolase family 127 protein [Streptomyces sp. MA15]